MKSVTGKSAYAGWAGLVALVATVDYYGERTMSDAFRAAARTKYGRPVLVGVWGTLTLHIFGLLPERLDPFRIAIEAAKQRRNSAVIRLTEAAEAVFDTPQLSGEMDRIAAMGSSAEDGTASISVHLWVFYG